jgi:hypothetical protein
MLARGLQNVSQSAPLGAATAFAIEFFAGAGLPPAACGALAAAFGAPSARGGRADRATSALNPILYLRHLMTM